VKIGISNFPTEYSMGPVALGKALEERGFESLWVVEHTHVPASRRTPYPLGGDLPSVYWEAFEPFTFLAQAAAVTDELRIGTGICLVPEHHPVALAKRIASIDVLSGGRFLFGIGAGWLAEELENHGVSFQDRWQVTKEHILAMKACWTEKDAAFHGEFVDFDPVWVEPKPAQKPHPPIYIGANSKWAVERIVDYADGWLPVPTPDFPERLAQLNALCASTGRDRASIDVSLMTSVSDPDHLAGIASQGINRVILSLPTDGESASLQTLDDLSSVVEWAQDVS